MTGGIGLPKTGLGVLSVGVAGASVHVNMLTLAAFGLGMVLLGAALVRVGFRRRKSVGEA